MPKRVVCLFLLWTSVSLLAAVPSARPGMGAVPYTTGTTFRVWAPNASSVAVAGNFNNWSTTANPLAYEGNGLWSADVEGAALYQQYKYVINGSLWKIDPRARDVVSSTGNGIIVSTSHSWTPFTMPPWNELVIYELHVGTFHDTNLSDGKPGTWLSAMAKLDHLAALGVNAVQLMPVAEFPGDYSLGYNPCNLFAPESAYGTPAQMRQFIDACHQRGIAVLLDVVYNHWGPTDLEYSLWQFDGFSTSPDTGGIYFYENHLRYTPWGATRPNFDSGPVRSFIRDNVIYWLTDYNLDGIRMDGTAYIREVDIGGPEIPAGWSLMQWINNEIDAAFPAKISIAEDMRDNVWLTKPTGAGGAGFDSQWDPGFHHKVVAALETAYDDYRNMWDIRDAIVHLYNGWDTQRVIYTESHDEVGAASGKARVPSRIWWEQPASYYSKKRSTLGAGLVFTSPGIPMLFMGQEFLESGSWHDNTPLDWSKNTTFAGIRQLYTDLIALRRNRSGLTKGLMAKNVSVFHVNNSAKVIAFHRWWNGGPRDDVVIAANFSYQGFTSYNIGFPRPGRWRVRFNSDWNGYDSSFGNWNTLDVSAVPGPKDGLAYNADISIAPYSLVIFSQGTTPDLNQSGSVDLNDWALFADRWQSDCDSWDACGGADFNLSGRVDMEDLAFFVQHWLQQ
ncbi:MAG: alpha-amylase family glycosyl hydrolase [Anaerohalosphaeraceae bacterium]